MEDVTFASRSVPRHLLRGTVGFGLLFGSFALVPFAGPLVLLAAPVGFLALRGCPMCWTMGLVQTISRRRLERSCVDGSCRISVADRSPTAGPPAAPAEWTAGPPAAPAEWTAAPVAGHPGARVVDRMPVG